MSLRRNAPDSQALAIAREMQKKLKPAEIILLGSRAAGDHRHDSDVDLMAVVPDDNGKRAADGILRRLLSGKYEVPVVNVSTLTREEFRRTAPMAQSQAGQAARHGVTPDGTSLDYRPEREPETGEIRQATVYWLTLAERQVRSFVTLSEGERFTGFQIPALEGQKALERAFKGLLTSGNDAARFRRDAAVMWRQSKAAGRSRTGTGPGKWRSSSAPPQDQPGNGAASPSSPRPSGAVTSCRSSPNRNRKPCAGIWSRRSTC